MIIADSMEEVIPHFLTPVATYQKGLNTDYLPMNGMSSWGIQSWADHLAMILLSG